MPRIDDDLRALNSDARTVWGHYQPEMARAAANMSLAVYQNSRLSMREAEAARFQTALLNGCDACYNYRIARDLPGYIASVDAEAIANVGADRGVAPDEALYAAVEAGELEGLSDRERLAVEYAARIGTEPKGLPDDDAFWRRMHHAFEDREIVDLSYSITTWIAAGRFLHVLQLDSFCPAGVRHRELETAQ
ncbi:carboxymuconolactone decarboxylase family protein [Sphingomonas bacterium]|uniref:carboxymuconolactone decarboxylase family protein n=1 Tax=Sphingomonas bacterium TaxID=1895847 RepID=UPI00157705E7|nr:carboxymuconolactone decarboxylase family protein [Sphingomonas bacterium]